MCACVGRVRKMVNMKLECFGWMYCEIDIFQKDAALLMSFFSSVRLCVVYRLCP